MLKYYAALSIYIVGVIRWGHDATEHDIQPSSCSGLGVSGIPQLGRATSQNSNIPGYTVTILKYKAASISRITDDISRDHGLVQSDHIFRRSGLGGLRDTKTFYCSVCVQHYTLVYNGDTRILRLSTVV